jgi:hypothetical protein
MMLVWGERPVGEWGDEVSLCVVNRQIEAG